jgi:hypothetical protein
MAGSWQRVSRCLPKSPGATGGFDWSDRFRLIIEAAERLRTTSFVLDVEGQRALLHLRPRAAFKQAIAEKPSGRFMNRSRIHVMKRHPKGDW